MTETETAAVSDLVEAVWQVLDDMKQHGHCCCGAAKAALRIAYEPFRLADPEQAAMVDLMDLDDARRVMRECEY